jgi:hypothetical protein
MLVVCSACSLMHPVQCRYLFPPDGGWLVPGQMCHLAAQAYSSLADSSSSSSNVQVRCNSAAFPGMQMLHSALRHTLQPDVSSCDILCFLNVD